MKEETFLLITRKIMSNHISTFVELIKEPSMSYRLSNMSCIIERNRNWRIMSTDFGLKGVTGYIYSWDRRALFLSRYFGVGRRQKLIVSFLNEFSDCMHIARHARGVRKRTKEVVEATDIAEDTQNSADRNGSETNPTMRFSASGQVWLHSNSLILHGC